MLRPSSAWTLLESFRISEQYGCVDECTDLAHHGLLLEAFRISDQYGCEDECRDLAQHALY